MYLTDIVYYIFYIYIGRAQYTLGRARINPPDEYGATASPTFFHPSSIARSFVRPMNDTCGLIHTLYT